MPTYIALVTYTRQAKENMDAEPERYAETTEYFESVGVDVLAAYYGDIGPYDAVAVLDIEDSEKAEMIRLTVEAMGMHELEITEVFEPERYFELIDTAIE